MTVRENLLALLGGKKPERVPWFADLDYWITYLNDTGTMPAQYAGPFGRYKLSKDLNCGFYLQGHFTFNTIYENMEIEDGASGLEMWRHYKTPLGTLTERWRKLPESFSRAHYEHMVKSAADLKTLRYIYENTRYTANYNKCAEVSEQVGGNGVVLVYLPKSPFMEFAVYKAGIETLSYIAADAEDELLETIRIMDQKYEEAAAITLAAPADCIMIPENLSSEVIGKHFYGQYMRAHHEKWTRAIAKAGKYSFIHMDGTLKGLISEVASSGYSVLEALTPAPVGDLSLEEIRTAIAGRAVAWGGLPGGWFTDMLSDAEFDEKVMQTIEFMRNDPHFVLGVADQIPPYSRPERIRRVGELVDQYGLY